MTKWPPTKIVPIAFDIRDGFGHVQIEGFAEAESELLGCPDGNPIEPWLDLPHGIGFKKGLMTNAKRWWVRDDELLASYTNQYGARSRVRFTQDGCVG